MFGSFEALLDGAPVKGLHLREGERLLAYLALRQGLPVTYRALAQQFWPAEARVLPGEQGDFVNTRQAVRALRVALAGEAHRLASQGKSVVRLDLEGLTVDVEAYDRLSASGQASDWREAYALYRGPLLAGWNEPWVVEARSRRARAHQRLLQRLINEARGRADERTAATYLRACADAAPHDEELWRELIECLAGMEDFDGAEEAYAALWELRRPGAPDPETDALLARVRKQARCARPAGSIGRASTTLGQSAESASVALEAQAAPAPHGNYEALQVALLYKRGAKPDEQVLQMLESRLAAAGFRVFIDRHITVGVAWASEIEKQLRSSLAVIPLISASSIGSEMLEYEVEMAHRMAGAQGGKPRLLPVRVAFSGALPAHSALAAILDPLQYTLWQDERDSDRVAEAILAALREPHVAVAAPDRLETAGGAVALDSPFYIERPADRDLQTTIAAGGTTILIKGARQMGKTSLLARGLQQARTTGANAVLLDLQGLTTAQLSTLDSFLFSLAAAMAVQLDIDPPSRSAWNPDFGSNMNLEIFLRRRALAERGGALILGLDEVDRLFATRYYAEVFGLFRSWHNLRSLDPSGPWSRLTLAMAYSTEAHLFITDPNQSPFNVGTRLELHDFTPAQAAELNQRYGRPLRDDEVARLYRLVSGQPFLTRRSLDELASHALDLDTLVARADRQDGPFGDHLRRLLAALAAFPELMESTRLLLQGGQPAPDVFYRLRSLGLVTGDAYNVAHIRCSVYATFLARYLL